VRGTQLDVEAADGIADSYLVGPEEGEPRGGVLFFIDVFGLRPTTMEMADRIAAQGHLVLAPNTLYRGGRAPILPMPDFGEEGSRAAFMAKMKPLLGEASSEVAVRDGAAYLDALAEHVSGPAAISGYCMGGRIGWRIATAYPDRVAALGGFHTGGLVTDSPDSCHLLADQLRCEVYLGFADEDASMSAGQIAKLEAALDAAGANYTSETYSGARHGYTMADIPAYDEAGRERHYRALFDLLDRSFPA
jgi:carboxymethylenebutenolidase